MYLIFMEPIPGIVERPPRKIPLCKCIQFCPAPVALEEVEIYFIKSLDLSADDWKEHLEEASRDSSKNAFPCFVLVDQDFSN
ncbi:hypothetical protein TNIN_18781 [Trichonephila inaurata madagascariensis]|uniref:Uncharacterized protein n=1 Tax=Trichonephila inaurata madagascariensis TaxID=2747483 RepID=A0A8X6JZP3_9ARAC|nr:hypothetical protein TNIN_18781 [Trichonephila inaurata madagascariensis]